MTNNLSINNQYKVKHIYRLLQLNRLKNIVLLLKGTEMNLSMEVQFQITLRKTIAVISIISLSQNKTFRV